MNRDDSVTLIVVALVAWGLSALCYRLRALWYAFWIRYMLD